MKLSERILTMKDLIEEQDQLNEFTVPKWKKVMTPDHYLTQMVIESVELLCDSGIQYKWWSKPVPLEKFNEWNVKIELIDMLHFYLSMVQLESKRRGVDIEKFTEFYFGKDAAELFNNHEVKFSELLEDNRVVYSTYINILRGLLFVSTDELTTDVFHIVAYAVFQSLVCAVGLNTQELSAIYTAKCTLNRVRQTSGYKDGSYVKIEKGVEDNERLRPLVEDFLANPEMSLNLLAKNVRNEFFKQV